MEAPEGEGWVQDEDVLDTWFSSALWPFSTLGWPNNTKDLETYFPTDCLVTGYDIIFFWVARMAFQSEYLTDHRPFKDCVIHGLIRDKNGVKMSKSLGNTVDPFEMIDKYGADSLRYYLTTGGTMGLDLNFDEDKLTSTWNYINKIWNASRFVLMNIEGLEEINLDNLSNEDKWILTKYQTIVKSSINHMDKYEFNLFGSETYSFIYDDFCSNYIEMAKYSIDNIGTKSVLCLVLTGILKMLHPFMPFVTEEIYNMLPIKDTESIMISSYPEYDKNLIFKDEEIVVDDQIDFIKKFRNIKTENNMTKDLKIKFEDSIYNDLVIKVLRLNDNLTSEELSIKSYPVSSNNIKAVVYYEKEETSEDIKNKQKQIEELKASIARREKLLSNENYVSKAPSNIVEMDRAKLEEEKKKLEELTK